nr:MAG TPA: hypothetical protein [Caudoviricetes sp.]
MGCTVPLKVSAVRSPSPALCTPSLKMEPHTRKYCPGTTPAGTVSGSKANSPAMESSARSKKLCVSAHSSGTVMQSHPPCRLDRFARSDGLDSNTVQILSKQGHAHNGVALGGCSAVVCLSVEADEVACLACGPVDQTCAGKLAIRRIHIVHDDVVYRGGNNLSLRDLTVGQQEDGVVAHEILDVLEAELVLHGDIGIAQIVVHVHHVDKANNAGHGAMHGLELVLYRALGMCQRHLEGLGSALQGAGVQELVELIRYQSGQVVQELIIGLLHGDIVAVILDRLKGDRLAVLVDGDLAVLLLLDGVLAERDLFALAHGAALQGALCILALEHGARLHPDRAHDAQNGAQMVPVALETGHKVDFTRGYGDIGGHGDIFFCCHMLFLSAACKQVGICCNGRLAFASVLDCKNLVFGHFGAGVGGRGVHLRAGGGRSAYEVAPISFQAVGVLLGILDLAFIVQLQLVDVFAGQPHNAVCVLVQHPGGLQQLPELGFLGCVGVFLGLLGLVVGQCLFSGFLAAVGCVTVLFGFGEGCVLLIELVLQGVRFLMQHVQNFLELAAGVGRFIFQNRPESLAFECHVIVLSAHARAAMLGNKVYLPDVLPVWCRLQGSNLHLPGYEPGALPVVRKRHKKAADAVRQPLDIKFYGLVSTLGRMSVWK